MLRRFYAPVVMTLLVMLTLLSSQMARADETPEEALRQVTDTMIERLKANKDKVDSEPNYVLQLVNEVLVPHADFTEMSKRVLARSWRSASAAQRQSFTQAFQTLVIRTYAAAFRSYKGQTVKILDSRYGRSNKNLVEVNTVVQQNGEPDIDINYRLRKEGEQWKVYDMNVADVSLVKSFRAQFNDAIRQDGLDAVIADIEKRNKQGLASE